MMKLFGMVETVEAM